MEDDQKLDISVMYVEDEVGVRDTMARILNRKIKTIHFAANGKEGLELYKKYIPDLVITDIRMPVMDGIEMSREIRKINGNAQIIATSSYSDTELFLDSIDIGINRYVLKPIDMSILYSAIDRCADFISLEKRAREKITYIQRIIDFQENALAITDGVDSKYVNRAFLDLFGYETLDGFKKEHTCISEFFIKEEGFLHTGDCTDDILNGGRALIIDRRRNENRVFLYRINRFPNERNLRLVSLTDVTDMENEKKRFETLSVMDSLTQIYNRLKLNELIDYEIVRAKRFEHNLSLLMFDIDNFKRINDTFGHQVGDSVLKEIAGLVSKSVRSTNTFARWGGEEFVVLIVETAMEGAKTYAEKLRGDIEKYRFNIAGNVTCSFGVAQFMDGDDMESLVKRADEALYKAKDGGRNRVCTSS